MLRCGDRLLQRRLALGLVPVGDDDDDAAEIGLGGERAGRENERVVELRPRHRVGGDGAERRVGVRGRGLKPGEEDRLVAYVMTEMRSSRGFAATNERAAATASSSGLPTIERERSMARRMLFARPRLVAVRPVTACPFSVSAGESYVGASVTKIARTVGKSVASASMVAAVATTGATRTSSASSQASLSLRITGTRRSSLPGRSTGPRRPSPAGRSSAGGRPHSPPSSRGSAASAPCT